MSDGNDPKSNVHCNASFESCIKDDEDELTCKPELSIRSTVTDQLHHHRSVKDSVKESQRNSLELKIKMLNDVGVFKKKSPMASGSIKYFTSNEESIPIDYYTVNATAINVKTKEKKPIAHYENND